MNENHVSSTATSTDTAHVGGKPASPVAMPQPPAAAVRPSRWTAGRITALVIGSLLVLASVGLLGGGAVALWADAHPARRGRLRHDRRSHVLHVRIGVGDRAGPARFARGRVAVLIRPARERPDPRHAGEHRLGAVRGDRPHRRGRSLPRRGEPHGHLGLLDEQRWRPIGGGTPGSAPGTQDFWVASATGPGAQTLTWDPANGSWTVVVMNADGRPGVDVGADLGAEYPALLGIAIGVLAIGALLLVVGGFLIAGAIRRSRGRPTARTV